MRTYDVGWAATNQLIRSGRSFSGRERHCVFLNLGKNQRFADISSTSGLDFIDDGRGLALSDWDHDGRVDLWTMNRTGPRLRFVRNSLENPNAFLSLRLKGRHSNTDGIGARVEVILKKDSPAIAKTLSAGSGYLSQSSKWLHFGLGPKESSAIEAIKVHWPGGLAESFTGASPNGHFILREGQGVALPWDPPKVSVEIPESSAKDPSVPPEVPSRVILLKPAPIPAHLTFTDSSGQSQSLAKRFGEQALALHLFATWCPNCRKELESWTASARELEEAGLKVLAICVDEPTEDRLGKVQTFFRENKIPFEFGLANNQLIENLNALQRSFIGRQSDFPIPSTLLIDRAGRASAVYKGPVAPARLIDDAGICGAEPPAILAHAIPYPGKWKNPPSGLVPRSVAVKLIASGLLDDAHSYLLQLLPLYQNKPDELSRGELAECYRVLGAIAHQQRQYDTAVSRYRQSLEILPAQKMVLTELMRVHLDTGKTAEAAEQVEAILAINRDDFENLAQLGRLRQDLGEADQAISLYRESLALHFHPETSTALANLLRAQGECREALQLYRASLEARPNDVLAANNLAWILATHPDAGLRDGVQARKWAEVACELTLNRIPPLLGTLAAAHAESGQFEQAIDISKIAIASARQFKKEDLAKRLTDRMLLYQNRKPFRDPSLTIKPGR
jgi:tetratricopeptide (TPR) repeat protein/peroxiredoxin